MTARGLTRTLPCRQQVVQDVAADGAGQVDSSADDDAGGLDDLLAGGLECDGEAGPVGSVPGAVRVVSVMAIRRAG